MLPRFDFFPSLYLNPLIAVALILYVIESRQGLLRSQTKDIFFENRCGHLEQPMVYGFLPPSGNKAKGKGNAISSLPYCGAYEQTKTIVVSVPLEYKKKTFSPKSMARILTSCANAFFGLCRSTALYLKSSKEGNKRANSFAMDN